MGGARAVDSGHPVCAPNDAPNPWALHGRDRDARAGHRRDNRDSECRRCAAAPAAAVP